MSIQRALAESKRAEVDYLRERLDQFQFCIDQVAHALGDVCCGGVDSSPEIQLSDPHSTTRVLCDAIAKRKHSLKNLAVAAEVASAYIRSNRGQFFPSEAVCRADMLTELESALSTAGVLLGGKQMNAVQCPRCYKVVTKSCGPNCAWDWVETGEAELKRLRDSEGAQIRQTPTDSPASLLYTTRQYPCGCRAEGAGDVPAYCPEHECPPVAKETNTTETIVRSRELGYELAKRDYAPLIKACRDIHVLGNIDSVIAGIVKALSDLDNYPQARVDAVTQACVDALSDGGDGTAAKPKTARKAKRKARKGK